MLKRSLIRFNVWACIPLTVALVHIPTMAQSSPPTDYGTIEAVEIYRTADNQPINVGTVLGGVAGGVIGHQIGSGQFVLGVPLPATMDAIVTM